MGPFLGIASLAFVALQTAGVEERDAGCKSCHEGIEEMHPWPKLSCTQCHGGDGKATSKEKAHVLPSKNIPNDERVLPIDYDLKYLRFVNPTNLRVVEETCGGCHEKAVSDMKKSLHGTTAGHLSDGYYENGVVSKKTSRFSIFPIADEDAKENEASAEPGVTTYPRLESTPLPGIRSAPGTQKGKESFATHYSDLPRKACMQCHLWSEGRAVRGRLGMDGDYRGEGCAACHVPYADEGLSQSKDKSANRFEPGHPLTHTLNKAPDTATCVRCHYGDASIGLSFRGLAQLVPGQPAGPQVPGTTAKRLNGTYYLSDPKIAPPDVHHEKGMHCIDCHTVRDVMGDGKIYGFMEDAVEIRCQSCHGSFDRASDLKTSRGRKIENLYREGDKVILKSKVDGREHPVTQVKDLVTPGNPSFHAKAALAMDRNHKELACYTCHAGWIPNFFGFHFDRNESFTMLDTIAGERTPGRVTTQEKVFATFRNFYLGKRAGDTVAPYMVGFSTLGSAIDEKGKPYFSQKLPETAAGLSGMTMIHHQPHSTRGEARSCIDCHRNAATYGMGSEGFRLFREMVFATSQRGLEVLAINRKSPDDSLPIASVEIPNAFSLALETDPIQGHGRRAFVGCRPPMAETPEEIRAGTQENGIAIVDLANPAFPKRVDFIKVGDPQALLLSAKTLYVAQGKAGVSIYDVTGKAKPLGRAYTKDARALALSWPWLFVADGAAGLTVLDVANPQSPAILATLDLGLAREKTAPEGEGIENDAAQDIAILWQPSRPNPGETARTTARRIAAIACGKQILRLVDITEPTRPFSFQIEEPFRRFRPGRGQGRDLELARVGFASHYDLGSEGGEIPTEENDYLYMLFNSREGDQENASIAIFKVSDPMRPQFQAIHRLGRGLAHGLSLVKVYNAPFLQTFALIAQERILQFVDVSRPAQPASAGTLGMRQGRAIVPEEFALDQMIATDGTALKDISHPNSRYLSKEEIERLLKVPLDPSLFAGAQAPGKTSAPEKRRKGKEQ